MSLLAAAIWSLWLWFKWRVLGVAPNIFSEELLKKIALKHSKDGGKCLSKLLNPRFTKKEKGDFDYHLNAICDSAIREYVYEFAEWSIWPDAIPKEPPPLPVYLEEAQTQDLIPPCGTCGRSTP